MVDSSHLTIFLLAQCPTTYLISNRSIDMMLMMIMKKILMMTMTTIQEYGDRPPHLIHHDEKDGQSPKKKEPHIKKPLNAFMLYMKVSQLDDNVE